MLYHFGIVALQMMVLLEDSRDVWHLHLQVVADVAEESVESHVHNQGHHICRARRHHTSHRFVVRQHWTDHHLKKDVENGRLKPQTKATSNQTIFVWKNLRAHESFVRTMAWNWSDLRSFCLEVTPSAL